MEKQFTIAKDLGPEGDMPTCSDADQLAEYLTYLADVRASAVSDMGFTLEDLAQYIAGLRKHRR